MSTVDVDTHLSEISSDGYTIVENAIEPELVTSLRDMIRAKQTELGVEPRGNRTEGFATRRIYNLLARDPVFQAMPVHENVLPIVEGVLDAECLLSGMTAIDIGPGEIFQGMHSDEVVMTVPRPRIALMCTTMWALTDFTADNGATRIVPGSHRFDREPQTEERDGMPEEIAAEMPAGSVCIFHGGTWHSGGANATDDEWRLGVNLQYCQGFIRPQQNQYFAVPPEVASTFSERLLGLCGYRLYRGIMGHVDGQSPGAFAGFSGNETAYEDVRLGSKTQ